MPSGYEKSPGYGGPEPSNIGMIIAALIVIAVVIFLLFGFPAFAKLERDYQRRFCKGMDLEVVTKSGRSDRLRAIRWDLSKAKTCADDHP